MRKASIAIGAITVAAAGSAVFGGVALAGNHCCNSHHNGHHNGHHSNYDSGNRGGDGFGGNATNNCLNVGVPILSGIGIGGQGEAGGAGCYASANGDGGNAY